MWMGVDVTRHLSSCAPYEPSQGQASAVTPGHSFNRAARQELGRKRPVRFRASGCEKRTLRSARGWTTASGRQASVDEQRSLQLNQDLQPHSHRLWGDFHL